MTDRFTPVFTDAQRDAIIRSVFEEHRSVRQTMEMAREGKLGVQAFPCGMYAYEVIRRERQRRMQEMGLRSPESDPAKALYDAMYAVKTEWPHWSFGSTHHVAAVLQGLDAQGWTLRPARDLGWIKVFQCACGREVWQRPELWSGRCVRCERADV